MNFRKVRGLISLIVVVSMLLSVMPLAYASDTYSKYVDFPTGWSKAAMEYAVDNGLLYGRSDTTINPTDNLTRAEMATIINRVFGSTIKADISKYTDVTLNDWFYDEIAKAVNMRTFIGDSGTTMNPGESITREAVFTVIARALVLETEDYTSLEAYPDSNQVSDWAKSAAAILVSKGYIQGNDEGMLCPKCYITREEFAQMMYNIIKTYYVAEGTYKQTGEDSSLIRTSGVTLKNVTINGDLIIGDGVGKGKVELDNVIINGRLLCRGGEGSIKLYGTKVNEYVVVYDVNGTVHFDNYRTESVFKNMKELTPATFLKSSSGLGGYTGSGSNKPENPDIPNPPEPPTTEYYTVSFHNGASQEAFATVQVDQSAEEAERDLESIGKSLDTIYADYIGATLPAYDRDSLGYNNLGTEYTHQVNKEYLYEEAPGVWSEFTETTTINKNIDVYYATKYLVMEAELPFAGLSSLPIDIRYDSESRLADSLKDALITAGATLQQDIVKDEIDTKLAKAFGAISDETGVLDAEGNILDQDYGLKIADVIEYDQIAAEVEQYIEDMLNGEPEDLKAVIGLFDIPTLVDQIGGKELVNLIGIEAVRSMLKDETYKAEAVTFIRNKIKEDPSLIESVMNSDAKDALIENAANNNLFISQLLENEDFRDEILSIMQTDEMKNDLLDFLDKESVRDEILGIIKEDEEFKDSLTVIDPADANYEASLALRKVLVGSVADPGKVYGEGMSASAMQVRDAVFNVIDSTPEYASYSELIKGKNVYEAIIERYVTGSHSFTNIRFTPAQWAEYTGMIDEVIAVVVDKYFSTDADEQLDGELKAIIDGAIVDFAKDYVNGDPIIEGDADGDAKLQEIIEDTIVSFVQAYFAGETDLSDDTEIASFADEIKEQFVSKVKETDASTIQQPIVDFVSDPANAQFVDDFVSDNYEEIVDAVDNDFIMSYVNTLPDEEVNELVKSHANIDMIVDHINTMSPEERKQLAVKIGEILDSYQPFEEFMKAFKEKKNTIEINKTNTHFMAAVGKAIYGFDFNEILQILKSKGFGPAINFLGEDIIYDMFDASKEDYWRGLEPIIDEVEASSDPDIKRYYTTSMNITINVPLILHGIYDNYAAKLREKVEGNDIYDYAENTSLQKLVNLDWFGLMIGYDPDRIDEEAGVTGYYIKDYMDYYCELLDILIIVDDALCFYSDTEQYDEETFKEVKASLTKEFITFLEELQALPDKIENGQPIVAGYTLRDLINEVDSLKAVLNSAGGAMTNAQASAIQSAIDSIKGILEGLGEGNLPNGYTLDDLSSLAAKLEAVIADMNESEYDAVNETYSELISKAKGRLDSIITELDENGTIAGRPIENIASKISVLNTIYNRYSAQIKKLIAVLADAEFTEIDLQLSAEEMVEMLFGREGEDLYGVDRLVDAVKGNLEVNEEVTPGYNSGKMVIDSYTKALGDNSFILERIFY